MKNQQEITIKVTSDVAENYYNATEEERQQINLKIEFMLKFAMKSRQQAIAKLRQTMDEISMEAQEQGLTPEILKSLLNDNQ